MKKLIVILILLKIFTAAHSQVLKGTILDKQSNNPVSYATVYFNGTSVGTFSENDGSFVLDISRYKYMPVTISALGYFSKTISDFTTEKKCKIYLTPKVYELSEVAITANRSISRWERKTILELFRKQFLGESMNALSCKINNEDDILFSNSDDTLSAYSTKPILIENKSLGYNISYYLDKFIYSKISGDLIILGNYIFSEGPGLSISSNDKEITDIKRRNAYLGSRMHFLRSLWENNLESDGFSILDSAKVKLTYNDLVVESDSITKFIRYKGKLNLRYGKWTESQIDIIDKDIFFDKSGYYDPLSITWSGEMTKQRVGDLLPFEY